MAAKSTVAHRWGAVVVSSAWATIIQTGCVEVAVMASEWVTVPRSSMETTVGMQTAENNVVWVAVLVKLCIGMLETQ